MTPEQRITTLVLHGCAFYIPPSDDRYNQAWRLIGRFIDRSLSLRTTAMHLGWQIVHIGPASFRGIDKRLADWDAGLIASIPEELFVQYLTELGA